MASLNQICNTITTWFNSSPPSQPAWSAEDWQTFRFVSVVHGVAPWLYRLLQDITWLPPEINIWLAEQHHFNTERITLMHQELKQILTCFTAHQLPLLPLKGAVLTTHFYQEPGLRPMADLDFLTRPTDFEQVASLLQTLGYQASVRHWKHTEFIKPHNQAVVSDIADHPDNPRGLEIHSFCREQFGGPIIDLTTLMWQSSTITDLWESKIHLVKPEALWLHLVVHATYHLWQGKGRLIHLLDLVELTPHIQNPNIWLKDVDPRYTYPCLWLLNKYFPGTISETDLTIQSANLSPRFLAWVDTLNLVNTSYLNPHRQGLYFFKALQFSEGRPQEILQALRFSFLPSLEELSLDHPRLAQSPVPWLAYFLLPLDWFKRLRQR